MKGKTHRFYSNDYSHPSRVEVYKMIWWMQDKLKKHGFTELLEDPKDNGWFGWLVGCVG